MLLTKGMILNGHGNNKIMSENLITIIVTFIFLIIFVVGTGYACYSTWFDFSKIQTKLLKRNKTDKRWSIKHINTLWINHWSYRWFIRITALILFIMGLVVLVAFLYEFLA